LGWSVLLTFLGVFLGENWKIIEIYFRKFDWLIGILLVVGIIYFLYKKFKHIKKL
jgi:membrane protein DedA with SNARE-associated domain